MQRGPWLLTSIGGLVIIYSVVVLAYVATVPDLGVRCLLFDSDAERAGAEGVVIRSTEGLVNFFGEQRPSVGDVILKVRENSTPTFIHFAREVGALRNAQMPDGGYLGAGADPSELSFSSPLPTLLEIGEGNRWVEVQIQQGNTDKTYKCWLPVQSISFSEVLFSLVWFALQMGVFVVGALAYWNRPFDRSSRTFFAMCIATMGASLGAYHWWIVAGNLWLLVPCFVSAVLVPAVSLHFFTVFPRPNATILQYAVSTLIGIYAIPAVAALAAVILFSFIGWSVSSADAVASSERIRACLAAFRTGVYSYVVIASIYFAVTFLVVRNSLLTSRNVLERNQLRWIWRAALVAAICGAMTLYFVYFDRTRFALGPGRIPIFLASLAFMLAYTVGIVRYKLMLVDQVVSKGVLYYVVTYGLTIGVSLAIAMATMMPINLNKALSPQQTLSTAAVMILSVILLLWLRDAAQRTIDRQFFREKYQLDKALRRLNRATGHLSDPQSLGEMMLSSCRDVLVIERAALYLRSRGKGPFHLVSAFGLEKSMLEIEPSDELVDSLTRAGSLQRAIPGARNATSQAQVLLRDLGAGLIHALESEEGLIGLVVLGMKKNSGPFTAEDLTFLNALGQITNVALHSAKVDQEIARLNEELRMKMEKISEQQRQLTILQSEITSRRVDAPPIAQNEQPGEFRRDMVIGKSRAIERVLSTAQKVAGSESSVLIRGESGTGKELLAEVLHANSPRRSGPLVCVHCAALSQNLLESELFGHVKGSFTGAHQNRVGRFEMASGGTLFLDEIGDISLETQIKLLRVLQERSFEPVGGTRTVQVDVRLVTATHQNLEKLISAGRFREDLYYRLNVISVTLPPLRERMEDILELALFFLGRASQRIGKRVTHMSDEVLALLERHQWPGNIRELENLIERAVVLSDGEEITLRELPPEIVAAVGTTAGPRRVFESKPAKPATTTSGNGSRPVAADGDDINRLDEATEREMLIRALRECDGNKAQAARKLGIPRSTYFSKLKKYSIDV